MVSGSGNVGRPRLQVDVEEVAEIRKIGISITKISEIILASRSTLYRALEGSNLIGVTDISNQELDEAKRYGICMEPIVCIQSFETGN